ncbi:DUF3987 domain-containing protein, partial [Thermus sp.]|uniref:DUF3987 domain-containing protein n=1 Tax=Thermus sp. TaxID=275 RepID=UPI003D09CB56
PNGKRGIFLPLFGILGKDVRKLFELNGKPVGWPFEPNYAHPEALQKLVKAAPFLEVALQRRPSGSRHETAMALLNLARRAGVLKEAKVLLATERVFSLWGLEDTRTPTAWQEELDRLAEAAATEGYERKRGIPFLKELGFDPTPISRLSGEEPLEWARPKPLEDLEAPLPSWKLNLAPKELEELAIALAQWLLIDPTAFVLGALTGISAVLGHRGVLILPEEDNPNWEEAPVLWVALIGPPGSGKTPVLREATRPLWTIEGSLHENNRQEMERYEVELLNWKTAPKKEVRSPKPKPPTSRHLVVSDITPEKLAILLEHNPALLVEVDELKGLFLSWRREDRAAGRAFFLSAYEGKTTVVDRVTRVRVYLERPQLAILGGIQTGPWHRVVRGALQGREDADGLLQRFTPVVIDPLPPVRNPPPVPREAIQAYHDLVTRLWQDDLPTRLHLSPKAHDLWKEWRYQTQVDQRDRELPEAWRSYLGKRLGLTARLAGILSVCRGELGIISYESLARAIVLVGAVLEPHARWAWRVGQVGDLSLAVRLGKKLKETGVERFTKREVYTNEWAGITTSEEAGQALWLLEKAGWVRYDPQTRVYWVNPRIREEVGHAD